MTNWQKEKELKISVLLLLDSYLAVQLMIRQFASANYSPDVCLTPVNIFFYFSYKLVMKV